MHALVPTTVPAFRVFDLNVRPYGSVDRSDCDFAAVLGFRLWVLPLTIRSAAIEEP